MTVSTKRMNTHIPQNTRTDWNKEPSITILIKPNSGPEMDISSNPILCINGPVEKAIKIDAIK